MSKWDKLNKEFDEALDSMTSEDWTSWYERFKQKQITRNKMQDLRDAEDFMSRTELMLKIHNIQFQDTIKAPAEAVGGYRLGNTTLALTHKPNWLHRTMMRLCFGVEWVNDTK